MAAISEAGSNLPEICGICHDELDGNENVAQAVDHIFSEAHPSHNIPHYFHPSCFEAYRGQQQQPMCPYMDAYVSGFGRDLFAPPLPAEVPPLQGEILIALPEVPAILIAAQNGNLDQIQAELANGNVLDEHHRSALIWASSVGHLDIVQALLDDREIDEEDRSTATRYAFTGEHFEVVFTLLDSGPITAQTRRNIALRASEFGHAEIVQRLLNDGPIPEEDLPQLLRWASRNGHLNVIQLFGITEHNRLTILQPAAQQGHLNIVEAVLASGPLSGHERGLAVTYAAHGGQRQILERLLASGPISDAHRNDARSIALEKGHPDLIEVLQKKYSWKWIIAGTAFAAGTIAWLANRILMPK